MTDHAVTSTGIVTSSPVPYLDIDVEQDGITYKGRVYPVTAIQQRIPARCPDCKKIIAMREREKVFVWCQRCSAWHVDTALAT